jgi:hypothetical protein
MLNKTKVIDYEKIFRNEYKLLENSGGKIDPKTMPLFHKIRLNRSSNEEFQTTVDGIFYLFKQDKIQAVAAIKDRFNLKRIPQYVIKYKNKEFNQIEYNGKMKNMVEDLLRCFELNKLLDLFPNDFRLEPPKGAGATKPNFGKYYWLPRSWGADGFKKDIDNNDLSKKKTLKEKLKVLNSKIIFDEAGMWEIRTLGKYKFENFLK